jgi:uncharacterized protein (DUF1697 family)
VKIALLRGINLGPARRVPMAELRAMLDKAGYASVRTYLQSGNVVLESDATPHQLAAELEERLRSRFGFAVSVIVRSRDELAEVLTRNPFGERVTDPRRYQVTFLAAKPPAELAARLKAAAQGAEEVAVIGREIYTWHPDGIARSDLAKLVVDRRLGGTARNWNTVTALFELSA